MRTNGHYQHRQIGEGHKSAILLGSISYRKVRNRSNRNQLLRRKLFVHSLFTIINLPVSCRQRLDI
jgi:hypothetical protein